MPEFFVPLLPFTRTGGRGGGGRYSLTAQIRRSSRSVASNIAEAWRKRRYPGSFVAKPQTPARKGVHDEADQR
ncbi:MAG TPA: four helix bundle protein [Longimicrobiales bacterium]|nr:four helix bundle protein [Longimicrobiales bacterium]